VAKGKASRVAVGVAGLESGSLCIDTLYALVCASELKREVAGGGNEGYLARLKEHTAFIPGSNTNDL
jgi:hypothetical protein